MTAWKIQTTQYKRNNVMLKKNYNKMKVKSISANGIKVIENYC